MKTLDEIFNAQSPSAIIPSQGTSGSSTNPASSQKKSLDDIFGKKSSASFPAVRQAVDSLPDAQGGNFFDKASKEIGGVATEALGGLLTGSGKTLNILNTIGKTVAQTNPFYVRENQLQDKKNNTELESANNNFKNIISKELEQAQLNKNTKEISRLQGILQHASILPPASDPAHPINNYKTPFDSAIPATTEVADKLDAFAKKMGVSDFSQLLGKNIGEFISQAPILYAGGVAAEATGIPEIAAKFFLNPKAFPTIGKYVSPFISNTLKNIGAFGALNVASDTGQSTTLRDSMLFSVLPSFLKDAGTLGKIATVSGDAAFMGGLAKLDGASNTDAGIAAVLGGIMGVSGALGEKSVGTTDQAVQKLKSVASDTINEFSDTKITPQSSREEITSALQEAQNNAHSEKDKQSIATAKQFVNETHPFIKELYASHKEDIQNIANDVQQKSQASQETTKPQNMRDVMTRLEEGGYDKKQIVKIMSSLYEKNPAGQFSYRDIANEVSKNKPKNPPKQKGLVIIKEKKNGNIIANDVQTTFDTFKKLEKGAHVENPKKTIPTGLQISKQVSDITGIKNTDVVFTNQSLKHLSEKGSRGQDILNKVPEIIKNPDQIRKSTGKDRFLVSKVYTGLKGKRPHTVTVEVTEKDGHIIVTGFAGRSEYLKNFDLLWKTASSPEGEVLPSQHLPLQEDGGSSGFSALREGQNSQKTPENSISEKEESSSTKVSGVAKGIEADAIENGLTKTGFDDLAEYSPAVKKEQASLISELMNRDIEKAKRMATGKEPMQQNIRGEALFSTMKDYATKTKDVQLAIDLAKSPIATEISQAGSTLSLSNVATDSQSATGAIQTVIKNRTKAIKEKLKGKSIEQAKKEIVTTLRQEIKKNASKRQNWDDFIKSIECK